MFKVLFHKKALKFYDKIDKNTIRKFNEAIENLRTNPFVGNDIQKLRGKLAGKYRLRVRSLRVVYRVEKEKNIVLVESIGGRGDVY